MMNKLGILLGAGVGYVLGARAGRERYDQITDTATRWWRDPRVQDAASQAQDVAADAADRAGHSAKDTLHGVKHMAQKKLHGEGSEEGVPTPPPSGGPTRFGTHAPPPPPSPSTPSGPLPPHTRD